MRVTAPFGNIFGPAVKSVSLHTLLRTALCGEVGALQTACLLCQGALQTGYTKGRLAGGLGRCDQPLLVASRSSWVTQQQPFTPTAAFDCSGSWLGPRFFPLSQNRPLCPSMRYPQQQISTPAKGSVSQHLRGLLGALRLSALAGKGPLLRSLGPDSMGSPLASPGLVPAPGPSSKLLGSEEPISFSLFPQHTVAIELFLLTLIVPTLHLKLSNICLTNSFYQIPSLN